MCLFWYNSAMKILAIKLGKNKSRVLTDKGEYVFANDTIYQYSITQDKEIDDKQFCIVKDESDKILAKQYVFGLLSRQVKSRLQVAKRLKEKGFSAAVIEYALDIAEEYKYIDDTNYAQCYINTYIKRKGQKLIKYELRKAGIEQDIVEQLLHGREEDMINAAKNAVEKLIKRKPDITRDVLYRHLYNKGYEYDTINCAITETMEQYAQRE